MAANLLIKRSLIETVNIQLKNVSQIAHSRHQGFIVGFLSYGDVFLLFAT
ncbi:transposase [Xenorhabdus szentirmaii]|uniref:Transposase DDE domain-containing protein n=1 Tax=Xenorhabdus szentirmaii DSM 16338 TaxID=1427518 RepID=W1IZH0_9GAMM|nr:transposase [Xenorhabdus szentirmaii DSM 16338]PHM40714.1 transposase [Xenorhabdus szentirmaii]CDL82605.1 hypothetical protein XSR1_210041 [Xenorhabdus szentirmaii DSM 16338]